VEINLKKFSPQLFKNKKIIAFAGKKQSGKDSCKTFLKANSEELFNCNKASLFDIPLALGIKQFAIDYFGIDERLVYGTDEQKNSLTNLLFSSKYIGEHLAYHHPTVREVLQWIGEDAFLHIKADIWLEYWYNYAKEEQHWYNGIIISDIRKPEQVNFIKHLGGICIRLTRNIYKDKPDTHISETALDDYDFGDYVVDNEVMSPKEQYEAVVDLLSKEGLCENCDRTKLNFNVVSDT